MGTGKASINQEIGLGGVAIGESFEKISDERAEETLRAAWEAGIRYYDTSPWYGMGLSEHRYGKFLQNQPRREYVLSTKVGRVISNTGNLPEEDYRYDYSASGIRQSFEESLQRMGVDEVDFVFIHDLSPDHDDDYAEGTTWLDHFEVARKEAMPELTKMREEGLIRGWGLGVNTIDPILKTLESGANPDIFLSAIKYSLLDHKDSLDRLFPAVEEHNVELIAAAPFNSGLLAGKGRYNYSEDLPDETVRKAEQIKEVADTHQVDLVTASLQFSFAPKEVDTILFGASKPEQVKTNVEALDQEISVDFWGDLKKKELIDQRVVLPTGRKGT